MTLITYYRIVDISTLETVASGYYTLEQAREARDLYRRDYPHAFFEIESYTITVRIP